MVILVVEVVVAAMAAAKALVEGWRERVMEAKVMEVKEEEEKEEAMMVAAAVDRSHVHDVRNDVSCTMRSAITQVAPRIARTNEHISARGKRNVNAQRC